MIFGISGRPGGGKSYEAVKNHILPAIKDKRMIVTNLPLNLEHIKAVFGDEALKLIHVIDGQLHSFGDKERPFSKAEHFLEYSDWINDKGQGPVFFVDECHLCMPSGSTQKELLEYLSLHRHYVHDIYLITQDFRKVHRDIRAMIELNYRCIKKTALGRTDAYILKVCQGADSNAEVVNTFEREYEAHVFPFYKSHTKTSGGKIEEALAKDVKPWWKSPLILLPPIMLFIALPVAISAISKTVSNQQKNVTQPTANIELPVSPANVAKEPAVEPVAQTSIKPQQQQKKSTAYTSDDFHPLQTVQLHVTGVARHGPSGRQKTVFIGMSRNGQLVNEVDSIDLVMAGYQIDVLSDCLVRITWENYRNFILCDSPTTGIKLAGNLGES